MKLQRYILPASYGSDLDAEDEEWCRAEDVAALEAENESLRAKLARYENEGSTHAGDCWSWGRKHYECALAEIERLKTPPKVLSAEEVTEPGWYWWKKIGADDFDEPVQVFEDEHYITHDPILIISRIGCVGAISQECWKGQFIGPIQMPEV